MPYVHEANALLNELLPHLAAPPTLRRPTVVVDAVDALDPTLTAVVRARAYRAADGCERVVAVNAGDRPAVASLALDATSATEASRVFDANVTVPVVDGAFREYLDGLSTTIWSLGPGCAARDPGGDPSTNLVADPGFEHVQNPTVPAYPTCEETTRTSAHCYNYDMHAASWTLPSVDDGRDARDRRQRAEQKRTERARGPSRLALSALPFRGPRSKL